MGKLEIPTPKRRPRIAKSFVLERSFTLSKDPVPPIEDSKKNNQRDYSQFEAEAKKYIELKPLTAQAKDSDGRENYRILAEGLRKSDEQLKKERQQLDAPARKPVYRNEESPIIPNYHFRDIPHDEIKEFAKRLAIKNSSVLSTKEGAAFYAKYRGLIEPLVANEVKNVAQENKEIPSFEEQMAAVVEKIKKGRPLSEEEDSFKKDNISELREALKIQIESAATPTPAPVSKENIGKESPEQDATTEELEVFAEQLLKGGALTSTERIKFYKKYMGPLEKLIKEKRAEKAAGNTPIVKPPEVLRAEQKRPVTNEEIADLVRKFMRRENLSQTDLDIWDSEKTRVREHLKRFEKTEKKTPAKEEIVPVAEKKDSSTIPPSEAAKPETILEQPPIVIAVNKSAEKRAETIKRKKQIKELAERMYLDEELKLSPEEQKFYEENERDIKNQMRTLSASEMKFQNTMEKISSKSELPPLSPHVMDLLQRLGISEEYLKETTRDFHGLSEGKQIYALEKLRQNIDRDTTLEARDKAKQEVSEKAYLITSPIKWLKKRWKIIRTEARIAKNKVALFDQAKNTEMAKYQQDMEDIVLHVKDMPDIRYNDSGALYIEYEKMTGNPKIDAEAKALNRIATELGEIPFEWTIAKSKASNRQKNEYKRLAEHYEKQKEVLAKLKKKEFEAENPDKTEAETEARVNAKLGLWMSELDNSVNTGHLLNWAPEISRFKDEESNKLFFHTFVRHPEIRAVTSFILGSAARFYSRKAALLYGGAAGVMALGGILAWKGEAAAYKDKEEEMRYGKGHKDKGIKKYVNAKKEIEKIDKLIARIKKAEETSDKSLTKAELVEFLKARLERLYSARKEGRIVVGKRIGDATMINKALSRGSMTIFESSAAGEKFINDFDDKLERFYVANEKADNKADRRKFLRKVGMGSVGAATAGISFGAGWFATDYVWSQGGQDYGDRVNEVFTEGGDGPDDDVKPGRVKSATTLRNERLGITPDSTGTITVMPPAPEPEPDTTLAPTSAPVEDASTPDNSPTTPNTPATTPDSSGTPPVSTTPEALNTSSDTTNSSSPALEASTPETGSRFEDEEILSPNEEGELAENTGPRENAINNIQREIPSERITTAPDYELPKEIKDNLTFSKDGEVTGVADTSKFESVKDFRRNSGNFLADMSKSGLPENFQTRSWGMQALSKFAPEEEQFLALQDSLAKIPADSEQAVDIRKLMNNLGDSIREDLAAYAKENSGVETTGNFFKPLEEWSGRTSAGFEGEATASLGGAGGLETPNITPEAVQPVAEISPGTVETSTPNPIIKEELLTRSVEGGSPVIDFNSEDVHGRLKFDIDEDGQMVRATEQDDFYTDQGKEFQANPNKYINQDQVRDIVSNMKEKGVDMKPANLMRMMEDFIDRKAILDSRAIDPMSPEARVIKSEMNAVDALFDKYSGVSLTDRLEAIDSGNSPVSSFDEAEEVSETPTSSEWVTTGDDIPTESKVFTDAVTKFGEPVGGAGNIALFENGEAGFYAENTDLEIAREQAAESARANDFLGKRVYEGYMKTKDTGVYRVFYVFEK